MTYMSEWEIQQMAESALTSYEMTADWKVAYNAAVEFAMDEWEIKATKAQAATAVALYPEGSQPKAPTQTDTSRGKHGCGKIVITWLRRRPGPTARQAR